MKNVLNIFIVVVIMSLTTSFLFAQDTLRILRFPPVNLVDEMLQTKVIKLVNLFRYEYHLTSLTTSKQDIWAFDIPIECDVQNLDSPEGWIALTGRGVHRIGWGGDSAYFIRPGSSLEGFRFESSGLPAIITYYVEGWVEPLVLDFDPDSVVGGDVLEDSKKGKTIGAAYSPIPFIPINFLDTLISYTTQSCSLDWIKDQTTADKYLGYFNSAKTSLQQNNIASTRAALQHVLNDVNVDSLPAAGGHAPLTSEAYALIRYNTEYLLEKLPYEPTVPELLDTLRSRLQQAYTNGWIGERLLVQILDRSVQNAKSRYTAKDSIGCAQEIENFYKIVRLKYLATLKMRGRQFVTVEAYNLLYSYAKGIIGKVLTLPPRSSVSLIDQITALRAQIRTDASQGLIGGELLLRGLESSLDRAKQKLQKDDSTGTALYATLFQQTVRQVYALTKKLPKSRLYVKPEGYISLYYRAGYILEGLLEPVGQPMPKMDSALEEELRKYEKEAK